jgi:nitroimidazol reductase NimA-like FMN-containing flavoprotein (pyridoxamine 5'-phosphate oxidase superfamily)
MSLKTPRTTVRRMPKRGSYDFETVATILDAGFLCHLGFVADGQPYVIPTAYGREDRTLYVHGSAVSRTLGVLAQGVPVCVTVTHLDGLVLARSGFHSSMNYRSVMIFGRAETVAPEHKVHAMEVISEQIMRGRWADLRPTKRKEVNATAVLRIPIDEASAKVRTGPPGDDAPDYALPIWAGEIPLTLKAGKPIPDPRLTPDTLLPAHVRRWRR